MTGRAALAAAALALTTLLATGCGSGTSGTGELPRAASAAAPASGLSAATSLTASGSGETWAVIPMGSTGPNLFWQLFALPPAGGQWSLQTPSGAATNGALILASQDGAGSPGSAGQAAGRLTTGIRPSIDLSFSPVTATGDNGHSWSTVVPAAGLANVPDALAATPDGRLLALSGGGHVSTLATATASAWAALTSQRTLAATAAGRACSLTALTAIAATRSGTPLLGGDCGKAGQAGIFARSSDGTWRLAGPTLPAALAGAPVRVLRLTRAGGTDIALLETGSGSSAALVAAWSADGTGYWTLSPAYRLAGARPVSASFGAGGVGVILDGNRAVTLAGPRAAWRPTPALPVGQGVTLAVPAAGTAEALVASGSLLSVWRLGQHPARWSRVQHMTVPIEYGSSS